MRSTPHQRLMLAIAAALVFFIVHSPPALADDVSIWNEACAKADAGDLAGAKDLLTQLLDQYPASSKAPGAQLKLAYISLKTVPGSTQEAVDAFALVRTKYPASAEAAEALARIGFLHTKTSTSLAINDFTSFLAGHPEHPLAGSVRQSLGRLYLKTKELDKAEAAFDAVKSSPGVSAAIADEAALQSGFVKIMKFHASKKKEHLQAAIDALSKLTSSSRLNVRARADLGIAEAFLLMGKPIEAREKYTAAASAYADQSYFKGMALFGAACCSQSACRFAQAAEDYTALLQSLPGAGLAEKVSAWKQTALTSTSRSVQVSIESKGTWARLPGSDIPVQALYNKGKSLYLLKRYDEAIGALTELLQHLPEGDEVRVSANDLLKACNAGKEGQ